MTSSFITSVQLITLLFHIITITSPSCTKLCCSDCKVHLRYCTTYLQARGFMIETYSILKQNYRSPRLVRLVKENFFHSLSSQNNLQYTLALRLYRPNFNYTLSLHPHRPKVVPGHTLYPRNRFDSDRRKLSQTVLSVSDFVKWICEIWFWNLSFHNYLARVKFIM